jgi:hypothetical protein
MKQQDTTQQNSGAFSTLGAQQSGNTTYSLMTEQVIEKIRQQGNGTEFLVVHQVRQGEEPTIWSTGDPAQAKHLYELAGKTVFDKTPA